MLLPYLLIPLLIHSLTCLLPIEIFSNRFIKPSTDPAQEGEVFFIKGVDYQIGGSSGYEEDGDSDVLSDEEICYRDAYVFQQMGLNTIRVYTINPSVNHDACMSIFNDAGIYVILDLGSSLYSIYRENIEDSYNYNTFNRFFQVIDAFKGYPNLLGVFVGNEVINDDASLASDPRYIRAFQRDVKLYIQHQANRTIPVGYSAADVTELRLATWQYLQCNIDGLEDMSKSDFFGLNSYQWCSGISDWDSSGYDVVNSTFTGSTIPIFFSEYGCNTNSPRTFTEVSGGIYDGLIDVLSGGLVYQYSNEIADYGLVDIDSDGAVTYDQDMINLERQFNEIDIPNWSESDVVNNTISHCHTRDITRLYSKFGANFTIPDTLDSVMELILYGVNNSNIGAIIDVSARESNYTIYNTNDTVVDDAVVEFSSENEINSVSESTHLTTRRTSTSASETSTTSARSSSRSSSSESSSSSALAASNNYSNAGFMGILILIISLL